MNSNYWQGQGYNRDNDEPKNIKALVDELGMEPVARGDDQGKYECPICEDTKLSINRDGEQYDCYCCHERSKILGELFRRWREGKGYTPRDTRPFVPQKKTRQKKKALSPTDWDEGLRKLFDRKRQITHYPIFDEETREFTIDQRTGDIATVSSSCKKEALAELELRGLTKEAIEAAGIFSLDAGRTEVTGLVHKDFPGTYWTQDDTQWLQGMWINGAAQESIVIPRFSFWGARIGCQLRAIGPVEKGNRYRTLYSSKSASGNEVLYGEKGQTESGLTVCTPEIFGKEPNTPHRIYLSEAILKPLIACFKHNEFFIGAVSGLFLSSPKQFWEILVAAQASGVREIAIAPDYRTFPTNEKPHGNPGFVALWTKVYLWIHKKFPGKFEVLIAPAEGADIDEVDQLPELIPFQYWLAGAIKSSKKIRKMVDGVRKENRENRSALNGLQQVVRRLTRRVQEVTKYFERKSMAIVPWADNKRWESFYPSSPLKLDHLIYDPENSDSIDWQGEGPIPTIYYPPGSMTSLISTLYHEFGIRDFLNTGGTGEGKSHESASADPDSFKLEMEDVQIERKNGEIEQCGHNTIIWYFTRSHLNPTNAPLENFFEILQPRAEKLYAGDKKTPSGRSYIYTSDGNGKFSPIPNSGNCGRAKSHKFLAEFGYSAEYTTGLLCPTCPFYEECKNGRGTTKVRDERSGPNDTPFSYGFIYERWNIINEERQIHLNPNQPPTRRIEDGLIGISPVSDVSIFDDIHLETIKTRRITTEAIQKVYWQMSAYEERVIEENNRKEIKIVEQLPYILLPMMVRLFEILEHYDPKKFPHGMSDNEFWTEYCKGDLSKNPAVEAYNRLMELYPQPMELPTGDIWIKGGSSGYIRYKLNRILNNGKVLRDILPKIYRPQKVLEIVEQHAVPQWLTDFLMAAIGKGSIHASPGNIEVTVEDRTQVYRTRAAINIHLNATTTRKQLAQRIRVPVKKIVEIRPLPSIHNNLTIQGIKGFGKLTARTRSQDATKRLRAIIKRKIEEWGKDKVSLIDHKKHVESGIYDDLLPRDQQGWWFCHNRGTNAFERYPCRIAIGDPIVNWGRLAADWQATTGEQIDLDQKARDKHRAFWKYERELMEAERIQDVGRLRSGRKDEPCAYIKIGGDMNLEYLQKHYQDCNFEYLTADGEAAPREIRYQIRLSDICQAFKAIQERGEKPKLAAISEQTGLSTTMVSRNLKEYGGFRAFPKTCNSLLKELIADCKDPKVLSEGLQRLASAAFPEALAQYEAKRAAILARMQARELWTDRLVKDIARALTDSTLELIRPIAKMPGVSMRQFVHALKPESRQGLLQAVLTLFPSNSVLDELEVMLDFGFG